MPVPSFDVNNHIVNYIPRKKRKPLWISWFKGMLSQIDRLNKIFYDFINGSTDLGYWKITVNYSINDRVRTLFGTFESIVNGNLGNNPITDDGTKWIKILDSFIGTIERSSFTVQKLSFEYALNRRFQGSLTDNGFVGFKQPTSINPGVGYLPISDIYLTTDTLVYVSFAFSSKDEDTGTIGSSSSNNVIGSSTLNGNSTSYSSVIHIPVSVYNSLGSYNAERDSIIFNFANRLIRSGTVYKISPY